MREVFISLLYTVKSTISSFFESIKFPVSNSAHFLHTNSLKHSSAVFRQLSLSLYKKIKFLLALSSHCKSVRFINKFVDNWKKSVKRFLMDFFYHYLLTKQNGVPNSIFVVKSFFHNYINFESCYLVKSFISENIKFILFKKTQRIIFLTCHIKCHVQWEIIFLFEIVSLKFIIRDFLRSTDILFFWLEKASPYSA